MTLLSPRTCPPTGRRFSSRKEVISPDGRFVTGSGADSGFLIYPVKGGTPLPIAGLSEGEVPVRWSADGQSLYICRPLDLPARVFRLELSTGRREPWKELLPDDLAGVNVLAAIALTPDGRSYAYSSGQILSDLYLVD